AWFPSTSTEAWVHGEQGWSGGLTAFLVETIGSGWLAKLTAIGITIAAIALLLGLASGIASVVGVLMSANVMVAGSTAIDPLILVIAIGIALSWKTAGQIGLDRWFLPLVSEPVRNAVVSGTHHSRAHK